MVILFRGVLNRDIDLRYSIRWTICQIIQQHSLRGRNLQWNYQQLLHSTFLLETLEAISALDE